MRRLRDLGQFLLSAGRGPSSAAAAWLRDPSISWRRRLAQVGAGLVALTALLAGMVFLYALALVPFTPATSALRKAKVEKPAIVRTLDGKPLATLRRLNREWIPLRQVAPHVVDALVATEDKRFYSHRGIDVRRTVAALFHTLAGGRQGGSTLTQQLARNLFPEEIGRAPTLTRKLKEIITALKIEAVYTKEEILEAYLNTVPFLYNAFGIEMAARTYFGKPARSLSVLESATLVGMLKGTSYYNPVLNPERALARRNVVLQQMAASGKLERSRYERLRERPLRVDFEPQTPPEGPAPHFAEQVRRWLIAWADRNGRNVYADGLVVVTTLDSRLQEFANRAVARQLDRLQAVADVEWATSSEALFSTDIEAYVAQRTRVQPFAHFWSSRRGLVDDFIRETAQYRAMGAEVSDAERVSRLRADRGFVERLRAAKTRLQAGLMALDPRTGHVKAWVGSRDFGEDQYDHVIQARRQPGSTFKPFVYAAALQRGMTPDTVFHDGPVEIPLGGGQVWSPSDAQAPTGRQVSLREGLVFSRNTITARVIQQVGPDAVAKVARDMGVRQSRLQAVPSLALGTSPVTLSEMVSAYATIAHGGLYVEPLAVLRIEDDQGNVLEEFSRSGSRAIAENHARTLLAMMRGVVDSGTGVNIRRLFGIQAPVAGKTGTTQDNADGWFILVHQQLVAGAWVGFNDSRITLRSGHWGQGANNALLVVGDFFRQALLARMVEGRVGPPAAAPSPPERLVERFGRWMDRVFGGGPARPGPSPYSPQLRSEGDWIGPPPPPRSGERRREEREDWRERGVKSRDTETP